MKTPTARKPGRRSGLVVAMNGRQPRKQVMRHRCERRAKDARKHWSKDYE